MPLIPNAFVRATTTGTLLFVFATICVAQTPSEQKLAELQSGLRQLQSDVDELAKRPELQNRDGRARLADVAIFAKAVEWMLRHNEFPQKEYASQAAKAIELGRQRADQLRSESAPWELQTGVTVRGYFSRIDGSVQPYALTLPEGINPRSGERWPLHLKLHGRADKMNEVNFISRHEGKPLPKSQNWIQLDVYGRGNNAYRWAGETDVFEALADVRRRFRIDDNRVTLHGFSMGGAGAWHLGLHYPAMWSSVGPGAGFVDFYKYQNQTEQRPPWQHANLGIYDAIDYAMNAANVPVCTYGGENDAQLVASTSMVEAAKNLGVDIKLLVGPGMGHKFHPDSFKEFMAFHQEKSKTGRRRGRGRREIRFTTRTLKYNKCDWVTIHGVEEVYKPSTVEAKIQDDGDVSITPQNITVLSVARDVGNNVIIDGVKLPCYDAAEGLLPDVFYVRNGESWDVLDYKDSRNVTANTRMVIGSGLQKRHGLQGPIDDAFTDSFLCVVGSGQTTDTERQEWSDWTLQRFTSEYDKWMRAKLPVVVDTELTDEQMQGNNLILFGDADSNSVIRKVMPFLPVRWTKDEIKVGDKTFSTADHRVSLIYPNVLTNIQTTGPLSDRLRYIVLNSGHTFHEADFKASNSWLFPRLGDIAVQKVTRRDDGTFEEEVVWAANFKSNWRLP